MSADLTGDERLLRDLEHHLREFGPIVLTSSNGLFGVASEWGHEAPYSPMAGGAAYSLEPSLREAFLAFLRVR